MSKAILPPAFDECYPLHYTLALRQSLNSEPSFDYDFETPPSTMTFRSSPIADFTVFLNPLDATSRLITTAALEAFSSIPQSLEPYVSLLEECDSSTESILYGLKTRKESGSLAGKLEGEPDAIRIFSTREAIIRRLKMEATATTEATRKMLIRLYIDRYRERQQAIRKSPQAIIA